MAGFTLMELMIVLTLIALLSGGALRGWRGWQQARHLEESVHSLRLFLQRLRMEAHWQNSRRQLWWRADQQGCLGSGPAPEDACGRTRTVWRPVWPEVRLDTLRGEPGFYGKRDAAWPGSVELHSPAGRWRVLISARGRIRACRADSAGCR
ncbi:prepilin-type N-terminal cleavage/methylation domain-containing protein [Pantoea sp. 1.19]|uniref:prepilin-type N-terminal cleavage/methylation domain-containing protein n=1 Tax=Pantoea sp. 1.19 TaxID=1925589 RepID=UPI001F0AEE60|nr:prepilin-type N-terminal cleavage/methylation domain-containing protein [Pantoea sp. 1.19]